MKYVVWLIIVAAVVGGGWFYMQKQSQAAAAASAAAAPEPVAVDRKTVEVIVEATGKVASNRDVDIKCQASGKVTTMPFDVSDKVKAGDLLLQLDPIDQKRLVDQAQAQVASSQARYNQTQNVLEVAQLNLITSTQRIESALLSADTKSKDAASKLKRTQELFDSHLASAEELETAKTTAVQAQAAYDQAATDKAELDQQKKSLEGKQQDVLSAKAALDQDTYKLLTQTQQLTYTDVFVPNDEASKTADYRVSSVSVQPGTIVQSASSGLNGQTVMTLADVSHMFVLAQVDESDIGQIADPVNGSVGQAARVTIEAQKDKTFEGKVVRVATKGTTTQNVTTYEVKVEVTDPRKYLLKPDMTATADIVIASRPNVLRIPISAFRPNPREAAPVASAPATGESDSAGGATTTEAPASMPATTRGGGRGTGRGSTRPGRGQGTRPAVPLGSPQDGTVKVMSSDGKTTETRDVTVGLSDNNFYEVIKGLEEGELVIPNKLPPDSSRFQNQGGGGGGGRGGLGIPGLGGGGRR